MRERGGERERERGGGEERERGGGEGEEREGMRERMRNESNNTILRVFQYLLR